jgi:DNA-binding NtrC family response regulator
MEQVAQLVSEQVSDVYRVLIVDGDENLLALDHLALSKNGFEDETATSATDAPGMMADRMPDLVVLGADDFPTYSGIPEAGALISQHTLTRIQSDVVVRQAGRGRMMSVVRIPA